MDRDCAKKVINWDEGAVPFLMQTAQVMGEELKVIFDDHGCFDLKFRDMIKGGFLSMDEAKRYAPALVSEAISYSAESH